MNEARELKLKSHVGRDILQASMSFKTEASAVWEYVANSLQYVEKGTSPVINVHVDARARTITISDNGKGMDASALQHFFTMHAENLERRSGRPGRGKFGTGKSAAFGIAGSLVVNTVRGGLRNEVSITRAAIDRSSGEEIPLNWLNRDEEIDAPNGTVVTIGEVFLNKIDTASIIEYIERNLPYFRGSMPKVAVNNHVCEYREPRIVETFDFRPSTQQAAALGDVLLTIKVAQAPLAEADQGIAVTAGPSNLVAIERGGIERKEFGAYLFGEVDVPALEDPVHKVAPYDATRSLQLNPKHPVVAVLVGFLGSKLESVRGKLVEREREARQTEQSRRLADEAERIAKLLNDDFNSQLKKLREIRAATPQPGPVTSLFGALQEEGDEEHSVWLEGLDELGKLPERSKPRYGNGQGRPAPDIARIGEKDPEGNDLVNPAGGAGERKRRPRGGFKVDYKNLGSEEDRSKYVFQTMTILINLDHPVLAAALGVGGVEDVAFRRLSYEIAFGEYSIALGYEMAKHDPEIPADDLLYEVRTTLNRIARSASALYR